MRRISKILFKMESESGEKEEEKGIEMVHDLQGVGHNLILSQIKPQGSLLDVNCNMSNYIGKLAPFVSTYTILHQVH